jgi:cytochrome c oxidase subunit 2
MENGRSGVRFTTGALATLGLAGCTGPLSALDPAGPSAASIARLWWVMLAGGGLVLALVMTLLALSFSQAAWMKRIRGRSYLIWGGLVLPGATIAALLAFALLTGERLLADPRERDAVQMRAVGRQWAWRFGPMEGPLEENRLVVPAGRPVHVHVTSEDVIHSFWVPRLAGKIDAIPGHVNIIRILAPVPGTYHGACAEYCGTGHAAMPFVVVAVDEAVAPGETRP